MSAKHTAAAAIHAAYGATPLFRLCLYAAAVFAMPLLDIVYTLFAPLRFAPQRAIAVIPPPIRRHFYALFIYASTPRTLYADLRQLIFADAAA